ncbi:unnamed protein product [Clonostachys rosea]|uniref:C2H2-type domain-containing protein n=1 Tax=Bionectria ochroleuca TaxID=29856 RepID=A0ABY6U248_BIOOC|nr:unnamed protein product [Clonostachys rosea]
MSSSYLLTTSAYWVHRLAEWCPNITFTNTSPPTPPSPCAEPEQESVPEPMPETVWGRIECIISLFDTLPKNDEESLVAARWKRLMLKHASGLGVTADLSDTLETRFGWQASDEEAFKRGLERIYRFLCKEQCIPTHFEGGINGWILCMTITSTMRLRAPETASKTRHPDPNFDATEYQDLRQHLERVILFQKSEGREWEFGENPPSTTSVHAAGKVSIQDASSLRLQKLLINANLRRRHYFDLLERERPRAASSTSREDEPRPGISQSDNEDSTFYPYDIHPKTWEPYWTPKFYVNCRLPKPLPPDDEDGFSTCPLCFRTFSPDEMATPDFWRRHVINDLHPFTCFACDSETPIFSTYKAWLQHVRTHNINMARWMSCELCKKEGSNPKVLWQRYCDHLEKAHHIEREVMVEGLGEDLNILEQIQSCPLCQFSAPARSEALITHVIEHSMKFSLHALPPPYGYSASKKLDTNLSEYLTVTPDLVKQEEITDDAEIIDNEDIAANAEIIDHENIIDNEETADNVGTIKHPKIFGHLGSVKNAETVADGDTYQTSPGRIDGAMTSNPSSLVMSQTVKTDISNILRIISCPKRTKFDLLSAHSQGRNSSKASNIAGSTGSWTQTHPEGKDLVVDKDDPKSEKYGRELGSQWEANRGASTIFDRRSARGPKKILPPSRSEPMPISSPQYSPFTRQTMEISTALSRSNRQW